MGRAKSSAVTGQRPEDVRLTAAELRAFHAIDDSLRVIARLAVGRVKNTARAHTGQQLGPAAAVCGWNQIDSACRLTARNRGCLAIGNNLDCV